MFFTTVTGFGLNLNGLLRNFRASSLVNLNQTPVPTAFWPPIRFIPFVCRAVVFPSPSQDSPFWNNGGTALQVVRGCGGWALEGFVDNVSFLGLVRTHHSEIMGVRHCRWCGDVVGGHLKDLLTMCLSFG
jgi:hypothetical protein